MKDAPQCGTGVMQRRSQRFRKGGSHTNLKPMTFFACSFSSGDSDYVMRHLSTVRGALYMTVELELELNTCT